MHELSIALSLLDSIEEQAAKLGDVRVTAVCLRLGPLAGVVKEALLSAYGLAKCATPYEQTELRIEETLLTGFCLRCQTARPLQSPQDHRCAICNEPIREILSGQELDLTAIEIEE